ncbi:PAS domain S-box protein [Spirosoma sp. BT702]|uniref:histidine kinase n=1 Tax=Spirosoma profusum TaxID=2771354 RepID=A0A927GAQ5_9BACT|nr:PAS domain-containing sensor histidine kinase [Spirosoma profusum]MBD2705726.1 PAS domain S-box protein [Spirosoma profusum]
MLTILSTNALANLLFEHESDFLGIYDVQKDRYIRVNQAGVQLLGYPSEQTILDLPNPSFFNQPPNSESHSHSIATLVQAGHYKAEIELIRYVGDTLWGRINVTTFDQGKYALIRITNLDRLHRTERELEHSNRRNEAIFTNATIGIIVCDQQGKIVSANQLAHQLLGYDADDLSTLTIEQLVPKGVSRYHQKLRESFSTDPQVRAMGHNRDLYAQRKDGSVFPVEISLSYFRLEDELYVVAYIIDITFKKQAEQQLLAHRDHIERLNADLEQKVVDRTHALMNTLDQLEQSKDELAKALAAERELGELKSRFVTMASHEFRTPLTTVLNAATLIEKYSSDDQQEKRRKHLHLIRTSIKHLTDILEEFLSVGRLEEGKIEARPMEVYIDRLIGETIAEMQSMLHSGQSIHTNLSCQGPVWLDPSLFRKILVNLISNAVKYSGHKSIVTVTCTCLDGQLTLTVSDQGIGIAPEDQQHMFERFFRAKSVSNIPGTGLGLHIVGRYVELMNGQVSLTSVLNEGTTILISIPYENHTHN